MTGAENLSVLLRHQPAHLDTPIVCHLLNSNYDLEADAFRPLQNIKLEFNRGLLGKAFSRATLYAPERAPRAVDCRRAGADTAVTVPELDMWAVLKLE